MEIKSGSIKPLGASITKDGVNFAVYSKNATKIEVCLFDATGIELLACLPLLKDGEIFHGEVIGANNKQTYAYRAYGEFAPENGNRYDENKLLLDPYSLELTAPIILYDEMMELGANTTQLLPKTKIITTKPFGQKIYNVSDDKRIIYELNVKGFSALNQKIPPDIRGTFAGLATSSSVEYLKSLGINCVELMPCAAWIDERHLKRLGLKNYWGYNPICYMAPDPKLAPKGWTEVQEAVKTLNEAGIEVILDVVFNHSGESDEYGPTLSMRGLDNQNYYRLKDDKSKYANDAGTGNILKSDEEIIQNLIIDSLRAWVDYGGISGFRFDLAPTMLRNTSGVDFNSPLLQKIADDAVLSKCKLIAEPWDIGYGGYNLGNFPTEWDEWNDKYRDVMRAFWRGDTVSLGEFAQSLCGSQNIFHHKQKPKSINFITAHDGFTLQDLVSFDYKNNYANGENNYDGHNHNISCNHGIEGETDNISILDWRTRHQKNLLLSLFLSRGTPMIYMGSEFGKTQSGNNNAYCQDNEISWLDWNDFDEDLFKFTQKLIALRKEIAPIKAMDFLTGQTKDGLYPDIDWQLPNGSSLSPHNWDDKYGKVLTAILYQDEQRVLIAINRGSECEITLPTPRDYFEWQVEASSASTTPKIIDDKTIIEVFSVLLLKEKPCDKKYPVTTETLDKICDTLGIAKSWWDISGQETPAPLISKIKILSAIGMDCETEYSARKSLRDYIDKFILRPLPFYASFSGEAAQEFEIFATYATKFCLEIIDENGNLSKFDFNSEYSDFTAPDGRQIKRAILKLPLLPIGRYELRRTDYPEIICRVTIAPQTCYLPDTSILKGVSAQIYSLKRENNSDFGDFTTLKMALDKVGQKGFQILAINPLHTLFATDRSKKSPYYPSDRRFLEPLYIDVKTHTESQDDYIDYQTIWSKKLKILEAEFTSFIPDIDFEIFCKSQGEALVDFAIFETLSEKYAPLPWYKWDVSFKNHDTKTINQFVNKNQNRIEFFKFLQFKCDKELAAATNTGAKIARDLAIGSAPMGCENWCEQKSTAQGVSIGAPPDPLGPQGQVWGLPPKNPLAMIEDGFRNIAALFRTNMKYAGALRIDHALGLSRQFWVPENMNGREGTYIDFPFRHLLNELKLESNRAKCLIIAEDLGTVPNGFRETMEEAKALSYKVIPFEKIYDCFKSPSEYPFLSLACASTHDLPPIKGWWQMVDLKERFALGLYDEAEFEAAISERENEKIALVKTLKNEALLAKDFEANHISLQIMAAIHGFLGKTNSLLKVIQLEDLAGETIPINLPGTDSERKNWQKYIKLSINEIFSEENIWSKTTLSSLP